MAASYLDCYLCYGNRKLVTSVTGRNHRGPPGLEPRASRLLCEYSANWATEPFGRPLTFSPCIIRFVPESARNNGGTTTHVLFDARCPNRESTLSHQISQGRKNRSPTRTRSQGLRLTVRALCQLRVPSHLVVLGH